MDEQLRSDTVDLQAEKDLTALSNITTLIYALQGIGFLGGITFIAALVVNYVKLDDVKGTWLASHFRWQIRTFWYGLLWTAIGVITYLIVIGYVILLVNAVWVIYRIVKGWLCLYDKKQMYV